MEQTSQSSHQRIGLGMRVVAVLIDVGVLLVPALIVTFVVGAIAGPIIASLVTQVLILAYWAQEAVWGQAVGKRLLKYRITNQDGTPADQGKLIQRFLVKYSGSIIGLGGLVPGVGLLFSLGSLLLSLAVLVAAFFALNQDKLALYDKFLGTAVYGPSALPAGFPVVPGTANAAPASH